MSAFSFYMTLTPSVPPSIRPSTTSRRPKSVPHILQNVRTAIQSDHLGLALTLLRENPLLILPENIADELAGRLRHRGIHPRDDGSREEVFELLGGQECCENVGGVALEIQALLKNGRIDQAVELVKQVDGRVDIAVLERVVEVAGGMGQVSRCVYLVDTLYPKFGRKITANMLGGLVDACGRVGNLTRAVAVLEGLVFQRLVDEEKAIVYERVVDACIRSGNLERAEAIVERMRRGGVKRSPRVYEALLSGVAKRGQMERCWGVLETMKEDGVTLRSLGVYNALILGCSRAGRVEEAAKIYDSILKEGLQPGLDTYNGLLSCCARAGNVERAFEILKEMQEVGGIMPNPKSYNWVVVACAKVADVDGAFRVTKTMRKSGMRLNIVTKNNLVEACCNAGRLERAFSIVKIMVQEDRLSPNVHTYNTLIRGCGRWGQLDSALKILKSMQTAGVSPTVVTYSVAVDACARTGGPVALDRALELVDEMRGRGLEPNVVTYNSLIHTCARAKDVDQAFKAVDRMKEEKVAPDNVTLCSLVDACGRAGMIGKAFEAIRTLPKYFASAGHTSTLPAYNALLHGCCKAKDINGMEIALRDMKRLHLKANLVTFSTMISAHAAAGDVDKALLMVEDMKRAGFSPNRLTFTSIISAYGSEGNVECAMEVFEQAREICGEPDEELYTSAIVVAVGGGRVEMAVKLSKEMNRAGYVLPTVLNKWMRKAGEVERSGVELRNVLTAMQALEIKPKRSAMESLLEAYVKEVNVEASFALLGEMSEMGYGADLRTYRKVIQCCGLSGKDVDIEKACLLFEKVRSEYIESNESRLRSHEWVEIYEEIIRSVNRDMKGKYVGMMAGDCGKELAQSAAKRLL